MMTKRMVKKLMNKDNRAHWYMEGRHNDEVHCTNCNHAVGVQYDEEDNITGVPMVCPKCKSQMSNTIHILVHHMVMRKENNNV